MTWSTLASSIDLDLGREVEVPVVAELDLRADLDGRREDDRLALLGLDDLDVGVRQRQDRLLDERLAVGVVDEVLDRLVEDAAGPELRSSTAAAPCPGGSRGRGVRRESRRTASSTARLRRSGGSSISRTSELWGLGWS